MTKLLDIAVDRVRKLPQDDQETVAETLLALAELAESGPRYDLSADEAVAVDDGMAQAEQRDFASEQDMARTWKKFGL